MLSFPEYGMEGIGPPAGAAPSTIDCVGSHDPDSPYWDSAREKGTAISSLSLNQANHIIEGALQRSAELGYQPMAVVVVDDSGNIKAVQREDGASMFRVDVALGKAWGAAAFGIPSRELGERAKDNPNFFITLASTAHGKLLPQTGAVLIKDDDGHLLGAVGASGGTGPQDEEICIHGVSSVGLSHT